MSSNRMGVWRLLQRFRSVTTSCRVSHCWMDISSRQMSCLSEGNQSVLVIPILTPFKDAIYVRHYAKSRDKVKNVEKKVEIREDIMDEFINSTKMKNEMEKALERLKEQYIQNISLRSAHGAIENIPIEFEGNEYKLADLAQINRKNPKMIILNLSSFPQTMQTVMQALNISELNLNPVQDGTTISIPIPKVTREHRENYAKSAHTLFIKCKTAIRDVQIRYIKQLDMKKNEGLSTDQFLIIRNMITAVADQMIAKAEKMEKDKKNELLGND